MIDLHTHTFLSDGVLLPAELTRRAQVKGYRVIALTDHAGPSNLDFIVKRTVAAASELNPHVSIKIVPGVELTHTPPSLFGPLTKKARELGATIVVAHGETPVEPVAPGTNQAAIEAGVDILAHPGLITAEETELARKKGVLLEITTRKGHSLANGHVARMAKSFNAGMVLNTDAHAPSDLIDLEFARTVVLGAGLNETELEVMRENALELLRRIGQAPDTAR
ncbi:MAG: histidinol phosphate phosphatase domain-containing protein [Deltaproteobacteria bacterium]|nr:histidinol phosphate phosphatase domain-containing protein [Deltaproteobacteria bacterium]